MMRHAALMLAAVVVGCQGDIRLHDEVREHIHCGMTPVQVEGAVSPYGRVEHGVDGWAVRRGLATVDITFREGLVRTVQKRMYHTASTYVEVGPIEDLCDGTKSGVLVVSGPIELMHAAVYIDGTEAGELAPTAMEITVAIGEHDIRIEKAGFETVTGNVRFESDSGSARFDVDSQQVSRKR
jgi:PEGA domain